MDDDDDNKNVQFSMDNDFEGGEFMGGEFYYQEMKQKRKQSKLDALYGVFNDEEDDDDDYREKRVRGGQSNLSGSVSFVKATTLQEEQKQSKEPPKPKPQTVPKKLPTSLAFAPTASSLGKINSNSSGGGGNDNGGAKQDWEKYTKGIGSKLLEKMGYVAGSGLGKNQQGIKKAINVKLREKQVGLGFGGREKTDEDVQAEIIMRASEQQKAMKGTKIGVDLDKQQPQAPVRASAWKKSNAKEVRKTRKYKTAQEILSKNKQDSMMDDDDNDENNKSINQQTKILDMRGPGVRVIHSLKDINKEQNVEAQLTSQNLPELQHNLRLLVDLAESDIQRFDSRVITEKDSAKRLFQDKIALENQTKIEEEQVRRLEFITNTVSEMKSKLETNPSEFDGFNLQLLDEFEITFTNLQLKYPEEYKKNNINMSALSLAIPLFKNITRHWQISQNPNFFSEKYLKWKKILSDPLTTAAIISTTSYLSKSSISSISSRPTGTTKSLPSILLFRRLIAETWLQHVRQFIVNEWYPKSPEILENLIDIWLPVVEKEIIDYVLLQYALPKLQKETDDWEPRTDPIPIHQWIHPWLPYIKTEFMLHIFDKIKFKLIRVLSQWHPSDTSALIVLRPWKDVWTNQSFETLLIQSIVPKIVICLREMVINAARQVTVDPIKWLFTWIDVIPDAMIIAILESDFFPKWHSVLGHWFASSQIIDYNQIMQWFTAWRSLFQERILQNDRIKQQFQQALNYINQVSAQSTSNNNSNNVKIAYPPPITTTQSNSVTTTTTTTTTTNSTTTTSGSSASSGPFTTSVARSLVESGSSSLREVVSRFAAEFGVTFMPHATKQHMGKPIYMLGQYQLVIDRSTAFLLEEGKWIPIDIDDIRDLVELQSY